MDIGESLHRRETSSNQTTPGWKLREVHAGLGLEPGPILRGDLRFEGGLAAGLAIAKLSPRPTAVMAVNDLTAVASSRV